MPDKLPPVMVLGDHFGYPGGVAHGVTTYFLNVIPALVEQGVKLTPVFLREPHPAAAALRDRGIEPVFLSAHRWNVHVVFEVAQLVRRNGCRIIHAAGIKATLVARIVARLTHTEALVHVHDMLYPGAVVGGLHNFFSRRSDLGICVSRAVQDVIIAGYHVAPERARVVHNGIPLDHIRNVAPGTRERVRQILNLPGEASVIAMVARMHPIKGHRSMIQIMAEIVKSCPEAILLLVGDGPERAACESLVRDLCLARQVRFLGQRNDVPELLAATDLVVIPSQSEGLGLAGIEALAAARPVVAFDAGGLRDVVNDGLDGRLVKPGDKQAFAAAVIGLLKEPETLNAFGQRGAIAAERFSLEAHIRELLKCYQEAATPKCNDLALRPSMRG
jgi:glycosyltransferase involved in cell wall biosynthesis